MEFENYTRKKLIKYCQDNKIAKYSRKRNRDIIELIQNELKIREEEKSGATKSWKNVLSDEDKRKKKKIKQRALYDEETLISALVILNPIFKEKRKEIGKQIRNIFKSDCYDIYVNKNLNGKNFENRALDIIDKYIPTRRTKFIKDINTKTKTVHKVSKNIVADYQLTPYTLSRKYKQQVNCKIPMILQEFLVPYFKYSFNEPYTTNFISVVNKNESRLMEFERKVKHTSVNIKNTKKNLEDLKDKRNKDEERLEECKKNLTVLNMKENLVFLIDEEFVNFQIQKYERDEHKVTFYNKIYGTIVIPVKSKNWESCSKNEIVKMIKLKIQMKNIAAKIIFKYVKKYT